MYAREVDGQVLNFRVSGMLWNDSLIMQDEESGSYWSHILGECTEGRLAGAKLDSIPSILTDYGSWKREYPLTTMMNWPSFQNQNWSKEAYRTLGLAKFAIGIRGARQVGHFSFEDLTEHPVVNFEFEGRPLVLLFMQDSGAARCFERRVNGTAAKFQHRATPTGGFEMVDEATGSIWNFTGLAISGPEQGQQLQVVNCIPTQVAAWRKFHPDSSKWDPRLNKFESITSDE